MRISTSSLPAGLRLPTRPHTDVDVTVKDVNNNLNDNIIAVGVVCPRPKLIT
jgi:hypothetical protein